MLLIFHIYLFYYHSGWKKIILGSTLQLKFQVLLKSGEIVVGLGKLNSAIKYIFFNFGKI